MMSALELVNVLRLSRLMESLKVRGYVRLEKARRCVAMYAWKKQLRVLAREKRRC